MRSPKRIQWYCLDCGAKYLDPLDDEPDHDCADELMDARIQGALLALSRVMLWHWLEAEAQADDTPLGTARELALSYAIRSGRLGLTDTTRTP